jgi:hypothetical protein
MRTLLTVLSLLAAATLARADVPAVEFDGQSYHLDSQEQPELPSGRTGNSVAEFTLQGQTVEDWTKLFAFHLYPDAGDDPTLAAVALGKVLKETNPDAQFALSENKADGNAIIDFLTWAPDSDVMEFNVFKYVRAEYGPGLIALQFAQRFRLGDMSVDDFRSLRERAVKAMAQTDVGPARTYFAGKAKERLGSARGASQAPAGAGH